MYRATWMLTWIALGSAALLGCIGGTSLESNPGYAYEPEKPTEIATLPEGDVGFLSVSSETETGYEIEVVFPGEYRDFVDYSNSDEGEPWYKRTAPITVISPVTIFDSQGVLGILPADADIRIRLWTENDGGAHCRPSAKLTIKKSSLKRPLAVTATEEGQYGGFVVHGALSKAPATRTFFELGHVEEYLTNTLILEGDYEADGETDVRIVSRDFLDSMFHVLETRHSSRDVVDGGP